MHKTKVRELLGNFVKYSASPGLDLSNCQRLASDKHMNVREVITNTNPSFCVRIQTTAKMFKVPEHQLHKILKTIKHSSSTNKKH